MGAAGGGPVGAGGLASAYGLFPNLDQGFAGSIPLPLEINGARVDLNQLPMKDELSGASRRNPVPKGQAGAIAAPLLFVSDGQINLQIPWEIDPSLGGVEISFSVDGVESEPVAVAVAQFAPGIFTFDFGPGREFGHISSCGGVAHCFEPRV